MENRSEYDISCVHIESRSKYKKGLLWLFPKLILTTQKCQTNELKHAKQVLK